MNLVKKRIFSAKQLEKFYIGYVIIIF